MAPNGAVYSQWQNNTHPSWWKDPGLKKVGWICLVCYFGIFTLGYDGSYLSGLQAITGWNDMFSTNGPGTLVEGWHLGLIGALAYIPALVATPAASWACDRFGRKPAIYFGCAGTIAGAVIGAAANGLGMLYAGRVIVGGFAYFASIGCILILNEVVHPRMRHIACALYLTTYYIGGIVASWSTFGCVYWNSSWAWRLPTLLQALGPVIIAIGMVVVVPESPRWLMAHGREDEARRILLALHANGAENDELVMNEIEEIAQAIQFERDGGNAGWGDFLKTPGNRKRLAILLLVSTGSQWSGLSVISYFIAVILRSVGIEDSAQIAGINGGLACFNWLMAIGGALLVERLGRRPLWLISTAGMLVTWVVFTALSGVFNNTGSGAVGAATVAFIFLYNGFYDIAWTPLSYSYTSEVLPTSLRASGMAIFSLGQAICCIINNFVNSIALEAIGYKYYFVYLGMLIFYLTMAYFYFPETRGYTSEEVGMLLDGKADEVLAAGLTGRETALKDTSKAVREERFLEHAGDETDSGKEVKV